MTVEVDLSASKTCSNQLNINNLLEHQRNNEHFSLCTAALKKSVSLLHFLVMFGWRHKKEFSGGESRAEFVPARRVFR